MLFDENISMAVFILQTYNASGRLWARHFSASFSSSFNSSRKKTGERRIIRLDVFIDARLYTSLHLIRLYTHYTSGRLHRCTKRFSSSRRIMRLSPVFIRDELNDEQNDALKCFAQSRPDALYVCSIKTAN